jgi:arylsulfatase A-like enzyme
MNRWFAYLHLMNPHLPYRASQEHLDAFDTSDYGDDPQPLTKRAQARVGGQAIRGTDDLRVYRSHYDASIHEADRMLGAVVDELEEQGLLSGTLIVVTSDHGEEFLDHGGMSHGSDPYGELLRVPLLFYYPRELAKGKRVAGPASILDIYPTLIDLFDFDTAAPLQGISLLPALRSGKPMTPPDRPFVTTHTPMGLKMNKRIDVLISGNLKLIVAYDGKGEESIELYDLVTDPEETTNLASDRPQDVSRLREEMAAERRRQEELRDSLGVDATSILLVPEDVAALQALGYLNAEAADETSDGLPAGSMTTNMPLQ